ncbi:hypothetical protein SD70_17485 [Gordoniibacillus kamchatkensis]|uniref:HTH arsR-type domain-containing protein n=1 Tax=Gordoniibacillus kamchatkensis TaxID=1590651 RepID=A0ABR5AFN2_9BACL|nr:winged helix-turn-helix domain-containing protein [Paenibacillus sp. VKM B-2647]KIL39854.1 hypothetical protein SD70_17485 [Paenibacillus sp. VKM B-2647]
MQLQFTYKDTHEFVTSFLTYVCKSVLRRSDRDKKWEAAIGKKLPEPVQAALAQDEKAGKFSKMGFIHLLAEACPFAEAGQFVSWLREQSAGDIYEHLSPYMKQFPEELGSLRDKIASYLEAWYEAYFAHIDREPLNLLQQEAADRMRQLKRMADADAFVEEVTNGLVFQEQERLQKLVLTPQYHAAPLNWIFTFDHVTLCHYAFDTSKYDEEEPSRLLKEAAKGLSDVNRLKMLRFLRGGPQSYIDVVKHMGLAKSTVYEHMLILRSAGLIRSYVVGDSAVAYGLRREGISKLQQELDSWLRI